MQVYAIDENRLVSAINADKGVNYECPECRAHVRLRRGKERQPHFFHLQKSSKCRLSQKGIIHLHLQNFVKSLFGAAEIESRFPEIGRIADVADFQSKRVFEIQYSPMDLDEAKGRCQDYESLGFQVIWILHDHTFNQSKITPTERFLRTKTCYFSNMDEKGQGCIYDQLEEVKGKRRLSKSDPYWVNLAVLNKLPRSKLPEELFHRSQTWPLYSEGDLIDLSLKGKFIPIKLRKIRMISRLKEAYLTWLHINLSKSCR